MRRYMVRILAGWTFWLTLAAIYYAYDAFGRAMVPKAARQAVDFLMTVEGVATWPVALGAGCSSGVTASNRRDG